MGAVKFSALSMISYDYEMLLRSIPRYIDYVDEVILGLDRDRLSWAGKTVEIPQSFFDALQKLDPAKKIRIIEDKFFVQGMTTNDLDFRERNILSTHAKPGHWIVSVDADEVLVNAREFFSYLEKLSQNSSDDVCVFGQWVMLYKRVPGGFLAVSSQPGDRLEVFPVATKMKNGFFAARHTHQRRVLSPLLAIHHSWARTDQQLRQKLWNWSHNADFGLESYYKLWQSVDQYNYKYLKNFHPVEPALWPSLVRIDDDKLDQIGIEDLRPEEDVINLPAIRATLKTWVTKSIGLTPSRRI